MRIRRLLLSLFFCAAMVGAATAVLAAGPAEDGPGTTSEVSAADGKALFSKFKCNECHSIDAQGIKRTGEVEEGEEPPADLSGYKKKAPAEAALKDYLLKKAKLNNAKHKKKFKGDDAELDTLAKWLLTL